MTGRLFASAMAVVALAGCQRAPQRDVLAEQGTKAAATIVNCVEKVSDGTCNRKTCKKDKRSDCAAFGAACVKSGHKYEGTRDEGTCTRVKISV